ncbi:hypothetical protein [Bordetella avium]|uniref:hypothetical protein n=1 Tax=Bordetella avium TaxID=521 RepID=UPI0015FF0D33|nr:hypothetical protein [Bordetella avium]
MAHLSLVHSGLIASPAHTLVFAVAGTHSAAQWLACTAPELSLAEYRETCLRQLLVNADPHNIMAVTAVFRQAYAQRIAAFIAGGNHHG